MKFTKLKKHLAVILSAAMVFSCFPATAMAAEPSDEAVAVESGAEDEIVGAEAEVEPATEVEEAEISAAEETLDEIAEESVTGVSANGADGEHTFINSGTFPQIDGITFNEFKNNGGHGITNNIYGDVYG